MTPTETKLAALDKIIAAVRAYLPPDGMTAEQFISTVIEAVDNPEFNESMLGRTPLHSTQPAAGYAALILRLHSVASAGDKEAMKDVHAAILLFEKTWPAETMAWREFASGRTE